MNTYKFYITLSDGNEMIATVTGNNGDEALEKLQEQKHFISFTKESEIDMYEIEKIEAPTADKSRFVYRTAKDIVFVGDSDNSLIVSFKKGNFNDNNIIWMSKNKKLKVTEIEKSVQDVKQWLQAEHPELIM